VKTIMKYASATAPFAAIVALALSACSPSAPPPVEPAPAPEVAPAAPAPAAPDVSQLPAGAYKIDPTHSTLIFHVSHLGFSAYTGSFSDFTIDLTLDPAAPEKATVSATIDLASLTIPKPPKGFVDELLSPAWLDKSTTPQMKFESASVTKTGPATADIAGNLTLKGVTKPVTLHATFNGGYPGHPMDPNARIGFSVKGVLKRSDFGISFGIPVPPSTMGVGDEVTFEIETELTGPALKAAGAATPPAQ
jgi:polyisoprenoid-binding protein YceI